MSRIEFSRRQFFSGGFAALIIGRVGAALPEPVPVLKATTLNPFAPGETENLVKMVVALMDESNVEAHMWANAVRRIRSGEAQLLDDVRKSATRLLLEGEVDDVSAPNELAVSQKNVVPPSIERALDAKSIQCK